LEKDPIVADLELLGNNLINPTVGRFISIVNKFLLKILFVLAILFSSIDRASGAEKIYFDYGLIQFSISIRYLESYANEGKIEGELATYSGYLTPEQLTSLRGILKTRLNLSPVAISQFFYSPQGEAILERLSVLIQTQARQPGFYGIRSALILAAADPEGLTILNILKKFPTKGVRIDSTIGFEILDRVSGLLEQTERAVELIEERSRQEIAIESDLDLSQVVALDSKGDISFTKQTFTLKHSSRSRRLPVDLYLPQVERDKPLSLIVISHGLGSDRTTFAYLAEHLASYGYAVAVPEHPGSNASQIEALLTGRAHKVTSARELLDRPLDITLLLDELAKSFGTEIDTQRVAIIGQSFGGFTALSLAGAKFNYDLLEETCSDLKNSLNLSLLLQCLAREIPKNQDNLQDERIAAAIVINPLTSSIFGEEELSKIQIPIMMVSGSADTVTPALWEQIEPFTWLETQYKYLVTIEGGTHFSTLGSGSGGIALPAEVLGNNPEIARDYLKVLSVAFASKYIQQDDRFSVYLTANYAEKISNYLLPFTLIHSLNLDDLDKESD
jgi:predicted dienelactone hydrolase